VSPIEIVSASAGTGKTFRISEIITSEIMAGTARPERLLATTFTIKAAGELISRIRIALLEKGLVEKAAGLDAAAIGTVDSICGQLVSDHAFELGLSPDLGTLDEYDAARIVGEVIAASTSPAEAEELEDVAARMPAFEWMDVVERLITAARANCIEEASFAALAAASLQDCLGFIGVSAQATPAAPVVPPVDGKAMERDLDVALARFIQETSGNGDTTGVTAKARARAEESRQRLKGGSGLPWKDWTALANLEPGVKSRGAAGQVQSAASGFMAHPRLKKDIEVAIGHSFAIAARAMDAYAQRKHRAGLMDFVDLERYAQKLLDDPIRRAEIGAGFDLLLVDEFQDTSPLQLSIFLSLAEVVRRSVWVGDQKQAIFGFRGTDPALMDAVIEAILGVEEPETLSTSYRSREPLVAITSSLFAPPFAERGLPKSRVLIDAKAKENPGDLCPPFERWNLKSTNKEGDPRAIAAGVAQLLDAAPLIRVRGKDEKRALAAGDIAVLARTNRDCAAIANELEAQGIAASIPRSGLLDTDLGGLALAGLRLWADRMDSLAAAEIARLTDQSGDAELWLAEALRQPAEGSERFLAPDSPAAVLIATSAAKPGAGPLEAFDLISAVLELPRRARAWGRALERAADLEAFRAAVRRYVARCEEAGSGSTVAGLVSWLANQSDEGKDARGCTDPARSVTVSTFHGAKGLEWPAVVLLDGGKRDRSKDALGVHVVPRPEGFDISAPLAGRSLRFWLDPFASSSKNSGYYAAAAATAEAGRCSSSEEYEALRLLYVSWTRARDILVLASRDGKLAEGMFGLLQQGGVPLLSEPAAGSAIWVGQTVACTIRSCIPAAPRPSLPTVSHSWQAAGPQAQAPATRSPSHMRSDFAQIVESIEIHPLLPHRRGAIDQHLGTALHAVLSIDGADASRSDRLAQIKVIFAAWGCTEALSADMLLPALDSYHEWIGKRWPGAERRREWPVDLVDASGSLIRGTVDEVVISPGGFAVIDHKSFPGDFEAFEERKLQYAGQLSAYAQAIGAATGLPCTGTWVHFPITGTMTLIHPAQA